MSDKELEEIARQIVTSAAANHLGWDKQMSMIEGALKQVRDTAWREAIKVAEYAKERP